MAITGQSSVPTAQQLTRDEVAGFARGAGFSDAEIPMAVAVAELESGRRPSAVGVLDHDDLGLMQINARYHPEIRTVNWKDPGVNMRVAFNIWQHGGWGQWHTVGAATLLSKTPAFTSTVKGSLGFVGKAVDAGAQVADVAKAPLQLVDMSARVGTFLVNPQNWERILFILIGAAVIIVGVSVVIRPYAEPVVKTGMKAAAVVAK